MFDHWGTGSLATSASAEVQVLAVTVSQPNLAKRVTSSDVHYSSTAEVLRDGFFSCVNDPFGGCGENATLPTAFPPDSVA